MPGYALPCYDAKRYHESDDGLILRGRAAVVPVRLWIEARTSALSLGTTAIKVQSTERS